MWPRKRMKGERRLYLTSRGLNTVVGRKLIAEAFRGEMLTEKRILVVTMAEYEVNEILENACLLMGFCKENIVLYDGYHKKQLKGVFDYIYIGEGNTFELLSMIRRHGLVSVIRESVERGAVYIGSSAGAIIAGKDVALAQDFDTNFVRIQEFGGLGLFDGTVLPHMSKERFEEYCETIDPSRMEGYHEIYCLDDKEILIIGDEVDVICELQKMWLTCTKIKKKDN